MTALELLPWTRTILLWWVNSRLHAAVEVLCASDDFSYSLSCLVHIAWQVVTKYASEGEKADGLNLVDQKSNISNGHNIGIAHTRWATHGGKTDANAHPHTDSSGRIALVHNGTLNNANELREELRSRGHMFNSETDTEVIAKLIGEYYEKNGCSSVK